MRIEPARLARAATSIALLATLAALSGCDSDGNGGPSAPMGLDVQLSGDEVQVTRSITAAAVGISGRDSLEVTWSVDGVVSGTDSVGTITQTNPATYTAPASVPQGGSVVIEARLASDASVSASDSLAVLFTVLHVDAEHGDDGSGTGTWAAPLKTITAALAGVAQGDTILVRPGVHDVGLGESPPYDIPANVTLRGVHRDSCTLFGDDMGFSVVNLADEATLERFTIGNAGDGLYAVYTREAGRIGWIRVSDPFEGVIRCYGQGSEAVIEDCVLENTRQRLGGQGMQLLWGCHATVRRCTLRGWSEGMFVTGTSDPRIEYCVIEGNGFGLETWEDNVQTKPDLGGGERGSLGGNVIRGNAFCGLSLRTPSTVFAINNTWNVAPDQPPVYCQSVGDSCDICATNGGLVYWCDCRPQ